MRVFNTYICIPFKSMFHSSCFNVCSMQVVMVFARPLLASPPTPAMSVPKQMLMGFRKVWIDAGSTQRVVVSVSASQMRLGLGFGFGLGLGLGLSLGLGFGLGLGLALGFGVEG